MDKKILTDEELNEKASELIDNVVKAGKENAKLLLNLIVEKTAQSAEKIFDKNILKLKQKIKERLLTNEQEQEEAES